MFTISKNGIITVNRGDTFSFTVSINVGTSIDNIEYNWPDEEHATLCFALMEPNQRWEDAILKKAYHKEDLVEDEETKIKRIEVKFKVEDTEYLLPGTYYYAIKLDRYVDNEETVDTIIPKTKFFIID